MGGHHHEVLQVTDKLLENLRPGFQADGYNIELLSANENKVEFRLVLTPNACVDCIMPSDYIVKMFQELIKKETNIDVDVHLKDPRNETVSLDQ